MSCGADPCYLSLDHTGQFLFVANYTGGSVAVFPLGADGAVQPAVDSKVHAGPVVPELADRQEGAHPHAIVLDPFVHKVSHPFKYIYTHMHTSH